MKRLLLVALTALLLLCNAEAQLMMDCDGDVGIGYMGSDPTYKLQLYGKLAVSCTPGANSGFYFTNYYTAPIIQPQWSSSAYIGLSNAKLWRIYSYNVHYNYLYSLSDLSLKENIRTIDSPLSTITNIRGVVFDFKQNHYKDSPEEKMASLIEEGKDNYGVIAQELKEVVPKLVKFNEESELFEVNYIGLIPILVEAIKEQQEMIQSLQIEVQSLNGDSNFKSASITTSSDGSVEITENALKQNSPNPFHESTEIFFALSLDTKNAVINVYNMSGTQLKSIELFQRGEGSILINGGELDAGMYMYAMIADGRVIATKQMILTD